MPNKKCIRLSPQAVFFFLAAGQMLFSVCYLGRTGGSAWHAIMPAQGADQFMDFFNHISYVRDPGMVYFASPHACFPPFVYLMYFLFSRILPQDATVMYCAESTSTHAMLLYAIYCALLAVFFFYAVCRVLKNRPAWLSLALSIAVILSDPYIFGVTQRGNSVMVACILLMLALDLRESRDAVHRELALFCIAAAAGVKIYPAVFGLLYLSERRWEEAGRLVVYGVLCFFAPFACFGGTAGMVQFFRNQGFVQGLEVPRIGSVKMSWEKLSAVLADHFAIGAGQPWGGAVLTAAAAGLLLAGFFLCREMYGKAVLLCGMMVLLPFWSGGYTRIYMCLPLVVFFRDQRGGEGKPGGYLFCVLSAMVFSVFIYNSPACVALFGADVSMAKSMLAVYAMCAMESGEAVFAWIREKRGMK